MRPRTKALLEVIIEDPKQQDLWLNSHNLQFGMHPQKMIDDGREDEVEDYLDWAVFGPY